jgi:O-antigen/teichoic acid export membrane protein
VTAIGAGCAIEAGSRSALETPAEGELCAAAPAARSLLHKTGWSTLATASLVLGRFAVTVFTARHLGPAGAGRLAYLLWIQEIVATITAFGMLSCVTRFVADLTGRGAAEEGRRLASWLYVRYLVLAVLGGVGIAAVAGWTAADRTIWLALGLGLIAQSTGAFYTAYLAGRQEFDRIARMNLVSSGVLVVGAGLGMLLWGIPGILLGYAAGSALPAALSGELLRGIRGRVRVPREMAATCLKYSWYAWCAALVSACVWSRIEVVFLERYWGTQEVAMFSIGLTLSALATQVPMLMSTALMPHFAESAGRSGTDGKTYASATRLLAALLFPLCFGTASLVPTLLPGVYGPAFRAAVPNAMVLTAFSVLALMNVGSALLYGSGRAWFVAASGFAGAILSLAGCAVVIPVWGAWGASLSRSGVQTAMAILGTWYIHRHLGCPAPLRALSKILLSALFSASVSYFIITRFPSFSAIALAIPVAAVVYLAMLRLTQALDPEDAVSLRSALERMPAPVGAPVSVLLEWLAI